MAGPRSSLVAMLLMIGVLSLPASAQEATRPVTPHGPALFPEPAFMTTAFDFAGRFSRSDSGAGKDGFYLKYGGMLTGAGWVAAGPGFRLRVLDDRAAIDAFAQVSWRGYLRASASFEFPLLLDGRLAAGTETLWQDSTQVNYFGLGAHSFPDLRSHYRLQTIDVVGYTRYRPRRRLTVSARAGWLDGPSVSSATGPFKRAYLDAQATFPNDPAMTLTEKPQFLHGEVGVSADTRDHPGRPASGALYRASASAYADRTLDAYSFRRYEVEGAQFIPLFNQAWVFALRGWGVFSDTSAGHAVPFYLTPSLGGANTVRSYPDYRFHDRHLLLASAESRWPLFQHIDAAVFVDAGSVASRVGDLGFDKTGYGFGVRVHSQTSTIARVDVAHGTDGWRVLLRMSDPFSLTRLTRWTAPVPFVP